MKLYVNEKLFSFHRKFYIKDEMNRDVYEISSKVFSLGDKTTIHDINGNKVAYIEQELFHFMSHYNVYVHDELVVKIAKKFKLFKNNYTLSNGYRVEGNAFMLNYTIFDDKNNQVGSIKRKFLSIGDKYEIEISESADKEIVLAIIVAITNDVNRNQASSSSASSSSS